MVEMLKMSAKLLRAKERVIAKTVVCGINLHVSSNPASIREKRKQTIVAEVAKTQDKNDIKVYLYDLESEKSNSCENRAAGGRSRAGARPKFERPRTI